MPSVVFSRLKTPALYALLAIFAMDAVSAFAPSTLLSSQTATKQYNGGQLQSGFADVNMFHRSTSLALTPSPDGDLMSSAKLLLVESLISNGVPALFTILIIGFAAFVLKPKKRNEMSMDIDDARNPAAELYNDLYKDDEQNIKGKGGPLAFLKSFKPKANPGRTNRGIPAQEFISVTNWNDKLNSYKYSLTAATESKAKAASDYRAKNFDRALNMVLEHSGDDSANDVISGAAKSRLLEAEKIFLEDGAKLLTEIQSIQTKLTRDAIDAEMEAMDVVLYEIDPIQTEEDSPTTTTKATPEKKKGKKEKRSKKEVEKNLVNLNLAQKMLMKAELNFVQDVVAILGPEFASGIRVALLGDIAARGSGGLLTQLQERPLSSMLKALNNSTETHNIIPKSKPGALFVTRFPGDVQASQVEDLREVVTAIVGNSNPGDEALVVLQSGGGTVTGYGLAAAQLLRLKEKGIRLTIAVEQVAASGGYMMTCVADKIVSSPFAVLGSIGVITDIPNVYERLKKEGIEFQTITAGKYKRTVTPTKKVTKEDFEKTKEDVEDIFNLFRDFVKQNRPQLDMEEVATGETWFGEDALKRNLTDEIRTVDEVLTEYVDAGWNVLEVEYSPPSDDALKLSGVGSSGNAFESESSSGLGQRAVRWLVRTLVSEARSELAVLDRDMDTSKSVERRYMAMDDTYNRIRTQD